MSGLARLLEPKAEDAYAFLRIMAGLMFAFHGLQGLFGVLLPPEYLPAVGTQGWYGKIIELVGGLAIAVGAFTSWGAFLASGTMAVAYVQFHWKLAFGANFFPAVNQGELALLYSVVFFYLACRGGGALSVDKLRAGK